MSAKSDPRPASVRSEYYHERPLRVREMLAAVTAGVAVGAATFYVARIALGRSPIARPIARATAGPIARPTDTVDRSARRPHLSRARNG